MGKSKTNEEFLKELSIINSTIDVLDEYITNSARVRCRCKIDGYEWSAIPTNLLRGEGCPQCGRRNASKLLTKSHEKFLEELFQINNNIDVIGQYCGNKKKLKCKCKIDGYEWETMPVHLLRGAGCPVCSNRVIVPGINDVSTTNPEAVIYFKNVDDSMRFSAGSSKKINVVCPDCGYEKQMAVYHLINYGFACPKCGDGVSYPNKFLRAMFDQLKVDCVSYEWSDAWSKPYKYDNYFVVNGKKYIIEADGGWHYVDNKLSGVSVYEAKKTDQLKEDLALNNGISVIRIDCRQSDKCYISNNILHSRLSDIFDLSCVDWDMCDCFAQKNLIKQVCELYNQSIDIVELSLLFHLHKRTIQSYLVKGNKFGWCAYSLRKSKKPIDVFDLKNNKLYSFTSVKQCVNKLSDICNINFAYTSVVNACNRSTPYKGFNFKWG